MTRPVPSEYVPPPSAVVFQMVTGGWVSHMIAVVARLGIADLLGDAPKRAEELAEACGAHGPSLSRVLRTLASIGLFVEDEDGRFELTPVGDVLRSDAPGSMRAVAAMCGESWHLGAWAHLLYSVKTGEPAFDKVHGKDLFAYLASDAAAGGWFNAAMTCLASLDAAVVAEAYDFSVFGSIVDVGGGHGALLAAILRSAPDLRGTLFDAPHVVAEACETMRGAGVEDRCALVGGDFFEWLPQGADAYVLRHIVHAWDEERAARILANCRRAMAPGGRVLVLESVIEPGHAPSHGKLLDIEMLVVTPHGRERTVAEYRSLFERAGLRLNRICPMVSPLSILEGVLAESPPAISTRGRRTARRHAGQV